MVNLESQNTSPSYVATSYVQNNELIDTIRASPSSSVSLPHPSNPPTADDRPSKPHQGAVVGGATGGVVILLSLAAITLLMRRRLRRGVPFKRNSSGSSFGNIIIIRTKTEEKTADLTSINRYTTSFSSFETGLFQLLCVVSAPDHDVECYHTATQDQCQRVEGSTDEAISPPPISETRSFDIACSDFER